MAYRSDRRNSNNNQEDQFGHLRYLPPPFHLPPRSRSSHTNRYPSAVGSGVQAFHHIPAQTSNQNYTEPSQEQRDQERYSMGYPEEEPLPRQPRSHSSRKSVGFQFPYLRIPASPSSGPASHLPSANNRFGVGTDQGLGYSGSNANANTNTSQAFSGDINPGNLSPFITGPDTGSGSSRTGQEYSYPYTATLHEPKPIQPPTTVPMQLEYILNRSGRRSSAASSRLSRSQEGLSHYSPPTPPNVLPSSSSGQEPTVSGSDTLPQPPVVSTNDTENGNDNNSRTPPQATTTTTTTTMPIRMEFEPVTAHTAKCDLCNSRNDSGMSRCTSCGWQSCHACTIANGCTRTHNAGSRLHTGPIERSKLVAMASSSSSRGRVGKQARAQPRRKMEEEEIGQGEGGEDGRAQVGPTRWSKRQQRARSQRPRKSGSKEGHGVDVDAASSSPPRSSPPGNEGSSSPTGAAHDLSETEIMFQGARYLYAFSIEAWGIWAREQRAEDQNRRGERLGIESLHSYAQDEATRALEEYKREAGRVNGVWS